MCSCITYNFRNIAITSNNEKALTLLRLDGYYYHYDTLERYLRPLVLYKDGYIGQIKFVWGNRYPMGTITIEESLNKDNESFKNFLEIMQGDDMNNSSHWGKYIIIDEGLITFQIIKPSSHGYIGVRWDMVEYKGKIINDSTFCIEDEKDY
jgi:hypothetical protein